MSRLLSGLLVKKFLTFLMMRGPAIMKNLIRVAIVTSDDKFQLISETPIKAPRNRTIMSPR